MNSYDLYGRIIDEKNIAKKSLTVTAFDSDPDFLGDDVLGKGTLTRRAFLRLDLTIQNSKNSGNSWKALQMYT